MNSWCPSLVLWSESFNYIWHFSSLDDDDDDGDGDDDDDDGDDDDDDDHDVWIGHGVTSLVAWWYQNRW